MYGVTPDNITRLEPGEIFCFGSNTRGCHGAGAALQALDFGAVKGVGRGLRGATYALPTKDTNIKTLPYRMVHENVLEALQMARQHPQYRWLFTQVGCGLAGLSPSRVAPMFFQDLEGNSLDTPSHICIPRLFHQLGRS